MGTVYHWLDWIRSLSLSAQAAAGSVSGHPGRALDCPDYAVRMERPDPAVPCSGFGEVPENPGQGAAGRRELHVDSGEMGPCPAGTACHSYRQGQALQGQLDSHQWTGQACFHRG